MKSVLAPFSLLISTFQLVGIASDTWVFGPRWVTQHIPQRCWRGGSDFRLCILKASGRRILDFSIHT
jgi:hypothetical protein